MHAANKCIYLRSGKSFTICSCSVKTKPSLFFLLCLPTFKGIILILFLSRLCHLRENPLLQYFFAHLSSSHPCLLHHPTSFFFFFFVFLSSSLFFNVGYSWLSTVMT